MDTTSAISSNALNSIGTDELRSHCRTAAGRIMERCDRLAECSEEPAHLTRTFCSPAMAEAHNLVRLWMAAAGMKTRLDPVANLIGRYGPDQVRQVLLVGSHLDTVVNAGRYDGALGVLLGLELVELLREGPSSLPFAIDVISFCEEEGIRYRSPFIGSRAVTDTFDVSLLDRTDDEGVTMQSALERLRSRAADCVETCGYDGDQVIGNIEPHIEQGPLLEREDLPVGIVEGIAGQSRACVRFVGRAGHAGTVPMEVRQDALAGAAEWIVHVETLARTMPGAVATVSNLAVHPNVPNVIPSEVSLRLDARHNEDARRTKLVADVFQAANAIAARRGLQFVVDWQEHFEAVPLDANLSAKLAKAVAECGVKPRWLRSGAGHDAGIMAVRFPSTMLFVRCREGISHHPDESVRVEDVAIALEVLLRMVHSLVAKGSD